MVRWRELSNEHVRELSLVSQALMEEEMQNKHQTENKPTDNQSENGTVESRKPLSHAQFYKACEMLKENKGVFLEERPSAPNGAVMLGKLCGFYISPYAFTEIKVATVISWTGKQTKREKSGTAKATRANAIRTLTVAVHRLYKELNITPTAALETLYKVECAYVPVDEAMKQATAEAERPR